MVRSTLPLVLALAVSWILWTETFNWQTGETKWVPESAHETHAECRTELRSTVDGLPTFDARMYRFEASADGITSSKYDSTTRQWLPIATARYKCLPATIDPRSKS
jgi:hypothetical protein